MKTHESNYHLFPSRFDICWSAVPRIGRPDVGLRDDERPEFRPCGHVHAGRISLLVPPPDDRKLLAVAMVCPSCFSSRRSCGAVSSAKSSCPGPCARIAAHFRASLHHHGVGEMGLGQLPLAVNIAGFLAETPSRSSGSPTPYTGFSCSSASVFVGT